MFYSPETGLDIDGAWIDMNEPSSVSQHLSSKHLVIHSRYRLFSLATVLQLSLHRPLPTGTRTGFASQ